MHFANGAAFAAVLFTILTQNLRFCSSAEAGIVPSCFYKIVLIKKNCKTAIFNSSLNNSIVLHVVK